MSASANRREALARAGLGAGAVAAVAFAPSLLRPARAAGQSVESEALRDFLVPAIVLEQIAALAYDTAADANRAGAPDRRTLERFRDHEQAHANALRSALDSLAFELPDAPDSPADSGALEGVEGLDDERAAELSALLSDLEKLDSQDRLLDYLAELEREQLRFYLEAVPELESEDLARTSAEIVGNQAQHLVLLGLARGEAPTAAVATVTRATDTTAG